MLCVSECACACVGACVRDCMSECIGETFLISSNLTREVETLQLDRFVATYKAPLV